MLVGGMLWQTWGMCFPRRIYKAVRLSGLALDVMCEDSTRRMEKSGIAN